MVLLGPSPFSSNLDWLLSRLLYSCCFGMSLHHQVSKLKLETQLTGKTRQQKNKTKKPRLLGHITSKNWNLSRELEERESLMKPLSDCRDKRRGTEFISRLYSKTNIETLLCQVLRCEHFITSFDTEIEIQHKSRFKFSVSFMTLLTFMLFLCILFSFMHFSQFFY